MSLISLIIFISIGLLITIAFLNTISMVRGFKEGELETQSSSMTEVSTKNAVDSQGADMSSMLTDLGNIFKYSVIMIAILLLTVFFIWSCMKFKPLSAIKRIKKKRIQKKYLKENPSLQAVLNLSKQFEGPLNLKYPNLSSVLLLFSTTFRLANTKKLDVLTYEYMYEIDFIKVVNQHSNSLEDSHKYLSELDETIAQNNLKKIRRTKKEILDVELDFYKELNSR